MGVKENAALKKAVKDNLSPDAFADKVTQEKRDSVEATMNMELPNDDYMFQISVVWNAPDVTPCHIGWLMRRLSDQIYVSDLGCLERARCHTLSHWLVDEAIERPDLWL